MGGMPSKDVPGEERGRDGEEEEGCLLSPVPQEGFSRASTFDFCGVGVWITWTLAQPDFFPLLFSLSLALTPCLSLFFLPRVYMPGLSVSSELREQSQGPFLAVRSPYPVI
jgi:hypothetical protein